ncbi:MAG: hypothetical protein IID33_11790, partial [Planctomycetes bacterium]|nr:hypothetical protein [Planctomycetota bacterium]
MFIALSESGSSGSIVLGPGRPMYRLSSNAAGGAQLGAGMLTVFRAAGPAARPPGVPMCGVSDEPIGDPGGGDTDGDLGPIKGLLHLELAIETDYEFYTLFNDLEAAAAYVTAMYAEVSAIYVSDVNTWMELTYVRLWDHWDDLFNEPDPLRSFRNYWNANMGHVNRDVAQYLSGRRDLPWGGVAWLRSLCGSSGYSVVGYAVGATPDPSAPSYFNYDVHVTAHELGHSFGAPHTHGIGIDDCFNLNTPAQRGTIMSYCSQTVSGGNSVTDLRFHSEIQLIMEDYLAGVACLNDDCNGNAIDDAEDIAQGTSQDLNGNGIPDECEDCNNNGTLDDEDIANGTSMDLNANGIPDECEPDCNSNGIPDDLDIASGFSEDIHGNNIPDECEADCDQDGTADYNQIMADMTLDIDRNQVLDACQDCDNDGVIDLDAIEDAHSVWVAGHGSDGTVRAFHAATGVLTRVTGEALVSQGNDLIVTPDRRVLVTSGGDHRVVEFDRTGVYVGDLVSAGSGGLNEPAGLTLGPDGDLYVSSRGTNNVLKYDIASGAFAGEFVAAGAGGLVAPFGLTFGPGGNLFVATGDGRVLEYDGSSGAFIREFVTFAGSGGLDGARGMTFKSDGNLLVCSLNTDSVLEYDGLSGEFVGKFNDAGTNVALTSDGPWGVRVGPNGHVYVSRHWVNAGDGNGGHGHDPRDPPPRQQKSIGDPVRLHVNSTRIYLFDGATGIFLRSYVTGNDTELDLPTGFDFMPGWEIDCNQNQLDDACDIASGYSQDANGNGIPDECETDCNANGVYDRLDIFPYGDSFDCNGNGIPDECDIESGASSDCNADGIPDECQIYTVIFDNGERERGWTFENLGATSGDWQRGTPVNDPDWDYDPIFDADFGGQCYLTQNELGNTDVDDGAVRMTSPLLDMSQGNVTISYSYFLKLTDTTGGVDRLLLEISSNGGAGPWTEIARHDTDGGIMWHYHQIDQADLDAAGVTLTANMQFRFTVNDADPQSIVEAGLDEFRVI